MNWAISRLFSRNGNGKHNGKSRINGISDAAVSRALAQLSAPKQQAGIRMSNLQSLEYALTSSGLGWSSDHRRESRQYVGWHYVAIKTIAQQVAQADVNVYRRLANLDSIKLSYNWESDDSEPVPWDHPLMKFLRRPNPQQSGAMFRFDCVLQLKLTGKLLIWNMRNQFGKVVRRYVIPTAIVEPRMPTPQYPEGYFRVKPELARLGAQGGWFFAGNYLPSVGWDIDSREVQVILDPHPIYRDDGQSPIAAAAQWTDQANEIDNARSSHMRNGPDSNLHVHINADIDEGVLARAEAKFNAKYVGTDRAGRAIFTAGENSGVEVTPLTFHPHEMEYTESFTQMRDAILALHGVPPLAAGVEQASGGESLYAPLKQFVFFVIQPMLDLFAEEDNETWVWQYGDHADDVYLEYTARQIDNPEQELAEANLLLSAKAVTVGELRTRLGLEKFGDERDDELAGGSSSQPGMPVPPGQNPPMPPNGSDEGAEPPIPFEPAMKGWLSYADEIYRSSGKPDECGAGSPGGKGFREGNTCASKHSDKTAFADSKWFRGYHKQTADIASQATRTKGSWFFTDNPVIAATYGAHVAGVDIDLGEVLDLSEIDTLDTQGAISALVEAGIPSELFAPIDPEEDAISQLFWNDDVIEAVKRAGYQAIIFNDLGTADNPYHRYRSAIVLEPSRVTINAWVSGDVRDEIRDLDVDDWQYNIFDVVAKSSPRSKCGAGEKGRPGFLRGNTCAKKGTRITDTPEFVRWFGGSKVVDTNGDPLVVYKGMPSKDWRTGEPITVIDSPNGPWAGFFSSSTSVAAKFRDAYATMGEAKLLAVYLKIEKPFEIDAKGRLARDFMFDDTVFGKDPTNPTPLAALESGYDGIIIRNTADEGDIYIPKSPDQIKSATDNSGSFDPLNPDITKSTTAAATSGCGAGKPGAPGFEHGNTCASDSNTPLSADEAFRREIVDIAKQFSFNDELSEVDIKDGDMLASYLIDNNLLPEGFNEIYLAQQHNQPENPEDVTYSEAEKFGWSPSEWIRRANSIMDSADVSDHVRGIVRIRMNAHYDSPNGYILALYDMADLVAKHDYSAANDLVDLAHNADAEIRDEIIPQILANPPSYEDALRKYVVEHLEDGPEAFVGKIAGSIAKTNTWYRHRSGYIMNFTASNGMRYTITADDKTYNGRHARDVQFATNGRYDITGTGRAFEVFSTVMGALYALHKHDPAPAITFTAAEPSRKRLYDRFVKRMASVVGDYRAITKDTRQARTYMVLDRDMDMPVPDDQYKVLVKSATASFVEWAVQRSYDRAVASGKISEDRQQKSSTGCGANQPGGGGFVHGNTCASGGRQPSSETPSQSAAQNQGGQQSQALAIQNDPTIPPPTGRVYNPDPNKDTDGDGVTDYSRVGVPAPNVPPPPEVPRLPNLSPDERAVETSFAEFYERDPDGVARLYRDKMKAGAIGDGPNIFNTDDAKLLNPVYQASLENRARYNVSVHQTANAIAKRAFIQHLDEVVMKLPEDKRTVLVTAGGVAAGKGYAVSKNPEVSRLADMAGAVWDSAGEQNATELPWVMEQLEKRGIRGTFVYVHADPQQIWTNPKRGVVERAKKKGRMVDARLFVESYRYGAENFDRFRKRHDDSDKHRFVVIDNTSATPKVINEVPRPVSDVDALHAKLIDHLHAAHVGPHIKRGGSIGLRIWSRKHESKSMSFVSFADELWSNQHA